MKRKYIGFILIAATLSSCGKRYVRPADPLVPALEYSRRLNNGSFQPGNVHQVAQQREELKKHRNQYAQNGANLRYEQGFPQEEGKVISQWRREDNEAQAPIIKDADYRAKYDTVNVSQHKLQPYGAPGLNPSDYNGPLSLGDPGQTASLWSASGRNNDFFRDIRAWQPMDLITIQILETTEGRKEADTEVKSKSTILAAIENLLGIAERQGAGHPDISLDNLVNATTQNDYKGEGETSRRDTLSGSISCMVAEVLPSGVLRIEGTKIISTNDEEQIMVLTGLVRTRDISSENIVQSNRVANMRIDYYGRGQLGDLQKEGWFARMMRTLWPF